ncbi:cytidylyltransferase domain-containing protein [Ruminococcus albus]|uniref:CMP-N,N'-diacetyllegionaminic acid synthase n=1 Tax=Ruminococcus albus TaxID=1264 RepID=A0A1I1RBY6_RUMAL|nr:acylneuraminate cytidylyltransferase family protein [Ruminococcus albus]SFD31667.1 CMP-N,N'-diacetyllegionaminic acid synthase [Ruminococcus albus]
MFNEKKILAVIPARGGSKGIPHKNIVDLCGKPLIVYSIEAGKKSRYIDYVMVSTDDEEIAKVAEQYGAEIPFMRPTDLASDTAKTIDAIIHAITELRKKGECFDVLVLLQPTAPLRNFEDVDKAIETFFSNNCFSLVSVSEVDDHPVLIRSIEEGKLKSLLNVSSTCRRQDMPKYYKVNGCIYINSINELTLNTSFNDNVIPYRMEKSHSVDIDELCDLYLAEYYLRKNSK